MSVYKEALYIMRELGQRQTRIYNDSCDYGIPIKNEKGEKAFSAVGQIMEMYFNKEVDTRKYEKFSCGETVTVKLSFLDEWNTGKEIPCTITYTRQSLKRTLHGDLVGILTIDCEWARN